MPELNYLAVLVSAVVAVILSGACYAALGARLASLHPAYAEPTGSQLMTLLVELARNLVVALVVAGLADHIPVTGVVDGLVLGLVLWVGFPVILLVGSVFHEKVPPTLAAIHAGDWLLKLLVITGIVGAWR